jgi:hypothetical protein
LAVFSALTLGVVLWRFEETLAILTFVKFKQSVAKLFDLSIGLT